MGRSCGVPLKTPVGMGVPPAVQRHQFLFSPQVQEIKTQQNRQNGIEVNERHGAQMLPGEIDENQIEGLHQDTKDRREENAPALTAAIEWPQQDGGERNHGETEGV